MRNDLKGNFDTRNVFNLKVDSYDALVEQLVRIPEWIHIGEQRGSEKGTYIKQ